jgi:transposase
MSDNENGFEKLKNLLPAEAHIVMEASDPYYCTLATYLHQHQIRVSVVNPLVIRRFCQMRMVRTKGFREFGVTEKPTLWKPDEPSITS